MSDTTGLIIKSSPPSIPSSSPTSPGRSLPWHWHKLAPAEVASAGEWGDGSPGWQAWRQHLTERKLPRPLTALLKTKPAPLLWALPHGDAEDLIEIVSPPGKKAARRQRLAEELPSWLAEAAGAPCDPIHALECIAWCHALPDLAAYATADAWWGMLAHLVSLTSETAGPDAARDPLTWQLLAGELPLTLAYLFPELKNCRRLADPAREALSAGMAELLDGEGCPKFDHLPLLQPLLATWTRSRAMGARLKDGCWNELAEAQFPKLVRQALRLTHRNGSQTFGPLDDDSVDTSLLATSAMLSGDRRLRQLVRGKLPKKADTTVAMRSEWAELALLRASWSPRSPRLAIGHSQRQLHLELEVDGVVLLAGRCDPELRFNGHELTPSSNWRQVRWMSDEDVDCLELEMSFAGLTLQRQLLLAREDRFLLVADMVQAPEPGRIELASRFPLAAGTAFEPAAETWEASLTGAKATLRALPLALPEWRSDPLTPGSLALEGDALCLRHTAVGVSACYAPLFFDLDARRHAKPLTWRRLTVGEVRQTQPLDVAAAYRAQIGKRQWAVYRSLNGIANRTVLGHHTFSQCVVGRFTNEGLVEPLFEYE